MDITKIQDNECDWYWIPNRLLCEFKNDLKGITGIDYMDNPDAFDEFTHKYYPYMTGGCPDLMPEFFKPKN